MTKPKRCSNKDMSKFTTFRTEFKNNNQTVFGRWHWDSKVYAVYSYGTHFPIYVYDQEAQQWYGNEDKYSRTTSCHQNYARPRTDYIEWANTKFLQRMILCQGVAGAVANRIESALTAA